MGVNLGAWFMKKGAKVEDSQEPEEKRKPKAGQREIKEWLHIQDSFVLIFSYSLLLEFY